MSTSSKERKAKMNALITDLKSGDDKKISKALKGLQVNGDDDAILPIIEVWSEGVSERTENAIITFIGDIKSSTSADIIMDILLDDTFKNIHLPLLTTIWNSKVDYSEYLVDFVTLAIQHDFMVTLECLTIIENMDGPFPEHHFLDAEIILREYAEKQQKNAVEDDKKLQLIGELRTVLKNMEQQNIDLL
ncbi:MAG: hypothetical protein ACQERC_04445 [Bacteroidota bacterium]